MPRPEIMMFGCAGRVIFFSKEVWPKAWEQAEERKKLQDEGKGGPKGKGRGKRRSVDSMASDIYHRTVQSKFDVAMAGQFGGKVWQS